MVVSVSLIRNGYEYGTVPNRCGTIHTESGHVVNHAAVKCPNSGRSGHSKGSCAYHMLFVAVQFIYGRTFYYLKLQALCLATSFLYGVSGYSAHFCY